MAAIRSPLWLARLLQEARRAPVRLVAVLLAGAFALLLAVQGLLVWTSVETTRRAAAAARQAAETAAPAALAAYELKEIAQRRMLLLLRMLAQPDPFERDADAHAFEAERHGFETLLQRLRALPIEPQARAQLQRALQDIERLSALQVPAAAALRAGDDAQARSLLDSGELFERQRAAQESLQRFVQQQQSVLQQALAQSHEVEREIQQRALVLGALLLALGLGIGAGVTRLAMRATAALELQRDHAEATAMLDPLTGALNRRGLQRELARWCHPEHGQSRRHSVLAIDLDRFKAVNDEAGHAAGDELLRRLVAVMRAMTRPSDRVARTGGDEFVILLREMDVAAALGVAQRLTDAVASFSLPWEGRLYQVGASIGVADFVSCGDLARCQAALAAADAACYEAKRAGRGRVRAAQPATAGETAPNAP
ncbi:MAG: diguanylate cyclase [Burkholderiaceae bacterium]|nr:diguanylate cyclase [Burkholderiaceae bacterium]